MSARIRPTAASRSRTNEERDPRMSVELDWESAIGSVDVDRWWSEAVPEPDPNPDGDHSHPEDQSWKQARDLARERDDDVCQYCGDDEESVFGGRLPALAPRRFDVHHVVPRSEFEQANDAHDLDNLVLLCRPCHMKLESLPPEKQLHLLRSKGVLGR